MKRIVLSIISLLVLVYSQAQMTRTTTTVPTVASGTIPALLYIPPDTTGTGNIPLIVFLHGSGESGTSLAKIYTSTTAGGPAYEIEQGRWPAGGVLNPADGQRYQEAVLCPQTNNGWSESGDDLNATLIAFVAAHKWVNIHRIYLTGLSSGAGGNMEYYGHLDNNETPGNTNSPRTYKIAAVAPMSVATNAYQNGWANRGVADSTGAWLFGDENNDTYGEVTLNWSNGINALRAGYSHLTHEPIFNTGHGPWEKYFNPSYRETFTYKGITATMNIYEWMLISTNPTATIITPTANAGSPQIITLPTNSVTLIGSGTGGTGHNITSYGWQKIAGPGTFTIVSPSSATTQVTGLVQGAYTFLLTVTNDIGATATSSVIITVNAASPPVANAGQDQAITLPVSVASLTGSGSTGTITSYLWSQVNGPSTATILSANTPNTNVSNLIAGTYTFQLSLNGGTSTDQVNVVVFPASQYPNCGSRTKYILQAGSDTGFFMAHNSLHFQPGDTLGIQVANGVSTLYWAYIQLQGLQGNPACPFVIINVGPGQPIIKDIILDSCTFVKLTGTGNLTSNFYGIKIEGDAQLRKQASTGLTIKGRSKNIEVEHIFEHNVNLGMVIESNESCDASSNYPNWILDSINVHDNKIVGTWNEGMYIGNTSPDNASYDLRPLYCNNGQECDPSGGGCDTSYPAPMKNGYAHVWNNIVDSTGRGGIQLANAEYGISEVNNNTVSHSGMNQDDAQGIGISFGLYTNVYCHDNKINNTYTWGIANLGGGHTNVPIRIENNQIDSSGYLAGYRLATTSRDTYDPRTEPVFQDTLPYPHGIFTTTKIRIYTTDNPPGTAVKGNDSTQFWIKNNTIGLFKSPLGGISLADYFAGTQKVGNIVCNNVRKTTGIPVTTILDDPTIQVNYSTNCGNTPPIVATSPIQSITLPTNSTTISCTITNSGGATTTSQIWTQTSGPAGAVILSANSLSTGITGLIVGSYTFTMTTIDSNGLTGIGSVIIIVNPSAVPNTYYLFFQRNTIIR